MLKRKEYKVYRHQAEKELKSKFQEGTLDDKTKGLILDHFLGCYDNDYRNESEMLLVWDKDPYISTSPIQRLNMFWVVPLYFVLVFPIMYVLTGCGGATSSSRLGRVLSRLLGNNY